MFEGKEERRLFLISAFTVFAFFAVVSLLATLGGGLEPGRPFLTIAGVDISAYAESVNRAILNVSVCIDNSGDAYSGEVEVEVKAYDAETNLLVATNRTKVGKIAPKKSEYTFCLLSLPKEGGYRIEVVVFENGKGILRAERKIYGLETLEPPGTAKISLRELDFMVASVESVGGKEYAKINTTLFIDNLGGDVSGLKALVKARDNETRLIADRKWVELGTLKCGTTSLRYATLTVPNRRDYIVEVQVFQHGRIIKESSGMVLLSPFANRTIVLEAQEKRVEISPSFKISDFIPLEKGRMPYATPIPKPLIPKPERAPAPPAQPGFETLFALSALILTAILGKARKGKSRKSKMEEERRKL